MERKILLRTEVTTPERDKNYMVRFNTIGLQSAKFVGNADDGVQRWLINKKIIHQNAKSLYIEKTMISGDGDEILFLLSRAFSKNRIDGEFELKLVERLMYDWEVDEILSFKATMEKIIEDKQAGIDADIQIRRKFYVVDPDGKKRTVKSGELSERSMVKMESGWCFSGCSTIPESAENKEKWVILPVLEEK